MYPRGRNGYYTYYHCRGGCKERIPVDKAHKALLSYFDDVAVVPEVADLYLEIMSNIFKTNESNSEKEIQKYKEALATSEKKLANLEEKFVMEEIERDSYNFMKPKFKAEIKEIQDKILKIHKVEPNFNKYLKFSLV